MFQHRPLRFSSGILAVAIAGWLSCAQAAEFGEPAVRSHIGQNLVADIELTGMQDPNVAVQVRLAHPDVYRGANIAVPPVSASLQLSVMRRDGRQFLHMVSTRPVQAEHLNLFLELSDGGRRHVRALTLWLTPDPQPAPPPPPLMPVPAPLPTPAPAPVAVVPTPVAAMPAPAKPAPLPKPLPVAGPAPLPATAPLSRQVQASPPAACPQVNAEQLRTCAALDYKNGVLQARIVELEEKVKALQLAIDGHGELARPELSKAATAAAAPGQPVMPKPRKKKTEPFPWLLAGAGVAGVAVLGALVIFLRRKKAMLKGEPPKPGLLARLRRRVPGRRQGADEAVPEPVEPTVG